MSEYLALIHFIQALILSYAAYYKYINSFICFLQKENSQNGETQAEENPLEFPAPNLIELENRVYTDSWSIPYKKNESLGKCLVAATRLAEKGLCETDDNCVRFLEKCMPECFHKLMNASAVNRYVMKSMPLGHCFRKVLDNNVQCYDEKNTYIIQDVA